MNFKEDFNFDSVVSHAVNTDWYRDYLAHHTGLRSENVEDLMIEWVAFKHYVPHDSPEWKFLAVMFMHKYVEIRLETVEDQNMWFMQDTIEILKQTLDEKPYKQVFEECSGCFRCVPYHSLKQEDKHIC